MKRTLFVIGIICLFSSCAVSKWPERVKNGGSCPENRGVTGVGGDHPAGMRH